MKITNSNQSHVHENNTNKRTRTCENIPFEIRRHGGVVLNTEEKKQKLLEELKERIGKKTGAPLTVAVIGTPGSGKSSFINTMITSITGNYRKWRRTADFGGLPVTQSGNRISREKYLYSADKSLREYDFPDFVEIAGFQNTNDEMTYELLDLLFYGRIPSNVHLANVAGEIRRHGKWFTDKMYPETPECKKFDRVIFVASAADRNLPVQLMQAVSRVLYKKRDIPVFGVFTKKDLEVQERESEDFEKLFRTTLGLSQLDYLHCTNYCDDNIKEIRERNMTHYPELDIPVLKFLIQVLDPIAECTDLQRNIGISKKSLEWKEIYLELKKLQAEIQTFHQKLNNTENEIQKMQSNSTSSRKRTENKIIEVKEQRNSFGKLPFVFLLYMTFALLIWIDNKNVICRINIEKTKTLSNVPGVVYFNRHQLYHLKSLSNSFLGDRKFSLIREEKDLSEINSKLVFIFINFNDLDIILEAENDISQLKKCAVEVVENAGVLHSKCLDKVLNKNISELEREIMLRISGESDSIVDDFLEENVLSVDDHEEISTEIKKSKAANLLLKNISSKLPRSFLKLLSILKEHKINDLGDRLLKDIDKTDWGTTEKEELKVEFIGGDMHFSLIAPKTEIKKIKMIISGDDGNERVFEKVIKEIPNSEEMIAQRTHCTFAKTSLGSITTILRIETSYAMSKLKQFIESEGISLLLTQIFESKDVRAILGKRKCNIEVQIREVQETTDTTCDEFQSTDSQASESTYRSRLERCKNFLLEELEPRCLLKEKEVADIFGPVFKKFSQPELRTTKAEVFLEYLKNQSEKEIEVVLKTLKEKNKYIYDQLFPETTKYQDIDINQVKGNILDNLRELLDTVNIRSIQTPLLSAGMISPEELEIIYKSSKSCRIETLRFLKLILHRGEEAMKVFLSALEIFCGECKAQNLLQLRSVQKTNINERGHAKIDYKAFNEESGLMFKGNFMLELIRKVDSKKEDKNVCTEDKSPTKDSYLETIVQGNLTESVKAVAAVLVVALIPWSVVGFVIGRFVGWVARSRRVAWQSLEFGSVVM
ncbi:uncharacterized protein LOC134245747 [Saccostrea cucullata]|uniref:uncharacterized protein LOC134245747 n=1 Tax=Saccostrea cuccullata TaxID=36930 RepID=UPI002ED6B523